MSYSAIANSEIDASSPLTETLMTKFRDNDLAGGPPYTAGDYIIQANDYERSSTSTSYVKLKEIKIKRDGGYRIKFTIRASIGSDAVYGRIYKNGSAIGTERSSTSTSGVEFSEDLTGFLQTDLLQIYCKQSGAETVYVTNFQICCAEEGSLSGY